MKIANLEFDEHQLAAICEQFGVIELYLFGSALRNDFTDASDIDVLYVLNEDADIGWGIVGLEEALANLFGRRVDLVSKKYLRPRFAERVLPDAQKIFTYAA